MSRKDNKLSYKDELKSLQVELLKMQYHIKETNQKILIIFEGRDTAGKGGTIKRFTQHINPRGCRVVALPKPTDRESTEWYFQRYVKELPAGGEIVLFDRSWYNRAVVEPVMGFCTLKQTDEFLKDVPLFEKMLVNSDIKIFKIFLNIEKDTQKKRFAQRRKNPLKSYKISPVDEKAQELWNQYSIAIYNMLLRTNSQDAPWILIDSNNKEEARINAIKSVLYEFDYPDKADEELLKPSKKTVLNVEDALTMLGDAMSNIDTEKFEKKIRNEMKENLN
ncbi:MAG: polyphosphate kinase 2 [Campylobacter sp.]|nr:polyphosphate kinase 2 [Campylobacter sp.]